MSRTEVRLVESKPPGYAQERFSTSALLVLAACAFGVFLSALDQTVVVTVLPSLITDLHIPFTRLDEAAWIVTGYLLGYTVAMPLVGRLTDAYGWRLTYFLCLSVFTLGSLGCALATSLPWLLTARVVQAAGGGGIVPVSLALASQLFSQRSRSLALGLVGAVAEAGGVLGPLYGALLVEHWGWRWIFLLNAPLSALVAAIILLALRSHPKDRAARISHRPSVDYVGAALVGGSLAFLTIALSQEAGSERPLGLTALLLAVSAGLFALFLRVEKRAAEPLLDLSLFRRPPFSATNLVSFLTGAAFITAMVDVPLFGATVLGLGAVESGLILLRLTVMIPVGALLGGWLSRHLGHRLTAGLGLATCVAGLHFISRWPASVDRVTLTADLVLAGLGFGLVIAPVSATAVAAVGSELAGTASALITVLRMVGMMVGLSALTSWGLGRFNALMANVPMPLPLEGETAEAFNQRATAYQAQLQAATLTVYHEIFLGASVLCALALAAVWFFHDRDSRSGFIN